MIDIVKKTLLTGVGLALKSKAEIEEMAKDFSEQSKMNQEEAKVFLRDCQDKYEETRSKLDSRIESAIENVLAKLDLPSRSDINALSERIDALAEKIAEKE